MSGAGAAHWDRVYAAHGPAGVSWHEDAPAMSLRMLAAAGAGPRDALIDVGGGASPLAGALLDRGWADVTVLDVSPQAVALAKDALGARAADVDWIEADVLEWIPARRWDVWHDRAVFHFLVEEEDRRRYRAAARAAVRRDGRLVVGTFAEDGPDSCSGLPVARYGPDALAAALGPGLEVVATRREVHRTPAGTPQAFTWVALRREDRGRPRTVDELLEEARSSLVRLSPAEARDAAARGGLIVDIRSESQRATQGLVPGARFVPRNVLEWRADPRGAHRDPALAVAGPLVLMCAEGYQSSLAAATLQRLGLANATDMAGGFLAWAAAGLPVERA